MQETEEFAGEDPTLRLQENYRWNSSYHINPEPEAKVSQRHFFECVVTWVCCDEVAADFDDPGNVNDPSENKHNRQSWVALEFIPEYKGKGRDDQ